jgi:chemotaxis protein MotB
MALAEGLQMEMDMNRTILAILAVGCVFAGGCVPQWKYDLAVAETETTRAQIKRRDADLVQSNAELAKRRNEIDALKSEIAEIERWSYGQSYRHGARVETLQKRLKHLEAAQAAAEERSRLYRDLSFRLKAQIDDGDLAIVVRDGRMVLQLSNDVLFDTGRTELKPAGKKALAEVANVIKALPTRQFQVAGHTDNVPIRNERFASNWELSSGRALRVVHFLIENGVSGGTLSAAGYADVDPVGANETVDGRKKNRRTEITLQPTIDELVEVPLEP